MALRATCIRSEADAASEPGRVDDDDEMSEAVFNSLLMKDEVPVEVNGPGVSVLSSSDAKSEDICELPEGCCDAWDECADSLTTPLFFLDMVML